LLSTSAKQHHHNLLFFVRQSYQVVHQTLAPPLSHIFYFEVSSSKARVEHDENWRVIHDKVLTLASIGPRIHYLVLILVPKSLGSNPFHSTRHLFASADSPYNAARSDYEYHSHYSQNSKRPNCLTPLRSNPECDGRRFNSYPVAAVYDDRVTARWHAPLQHIDSSRNLWWRCSNVVIAFQHESLIPMEFLTNYLVRTQNKIPTPSRSATGSSNEFGAILIEKNETKTLETIVALV